MYQSGKGYKPISKDLGLQRTTLRAIIHKLRKLGTVVNLPSFGWPTKITPRVQWWLIQEVIKEPRTTSKELQASLASIKLSVHDLTIRNRLGKNGIHGRVPMAKAIADQKEHKGLSFGKILCGLMQQNLLEGACPITSGVKSTQLFIKRTSYQQSNMVGVVWWSGAASGPGRLAIIDETMNSALYQKILKENICPSVCDLKLKCTWVMHQDNDPKHTSNSTSEWLKKN